LLIPTNYNFDLELKINLLPSSLLWRLWILQYFVKMMSMNAQPVFTFVTAFHISEAQIPTKLVWPPGQS